MNNPRLYVAPLEGLTNWKFRQIHARLFPHADQYYTPFLSPIEPPGLTPRALAEVDLSNNDGIRLVPQLLTNRVDYFINAAKTLAEMGYREVNLNLGCPSGTVVSKGKASGMLNDPDAVDRLLDGIFAESPIPVSVKTRIGRFAPDEIVPLMEVYNRYPISELTVHPRIRGQMYRGKPNMEQFAYVMSCAKMPVCYNGDVFTAEDAKNIWQAYPNLSAIMIGRGVIANPGLLGEIRGEARCDKKQLRQYHDEMLKGTAELLSGDRHILHRMKEIWFYLVTMFGDADKAVKKIRKSEHMNEYLAAVDALFDGCEIAIDAGFRGADDEI